nr:putative TATA-box binding protein [Oceanusvirus sp.]
MTKTTMSSVAVSPPPYRINTMTLTAKSGLPRIDLDVLKTVSVGHDAGIAHVSFVSSDRTIVRRGNVIKKNGRRRTYSKRMFDNQATVVAHVPEREGYVNIKLFRNGQLQMTGARSVQEGKHAVTNVLGKMGHDASRVHDVNVRLMNSDFRLGYRVDRDKLYALVTDVLGLRCSYNPSVYLAVKTYYMFNEHGDGVCRGECDGKKPGSCCKKITVFVFHTGAVIITGAVTVKQLEAAHSWITGIARTHENSIRYL